MKQKIAQTGGWIKQTAGKVARGADWLNQNLLKPGAKLSRDLGASDVADLLDNVGSAGQAVSRVGHMVNQGKVDGKELKRSAEDIQDSYRKGRAAGGRIHKSMKKVRV